LLVDDENELVVCVRCRRALDGSDPAEEPDRDQGPLCGECARERDFFDFGIEVETADDRDD
jgi:hypothetical protein